MMVGSTPRRSVLGLLGIIRARPGGALDNARQAARELSVTDAQRTLLTAELGTDADPGSEPGTLGRLSASEQDRLAEAIPEPWATGPRRDLIRVEPGRLEGRRLS